MEPYFVPIKGNFNALQSKGKQNKSGKRGKDWKDLRGTKGGSDGKWFAVTFVSTKNIANNQADTLHEWR